MGGLGYWTLNLKDNTLFISNELAEILEIDINLYENDPNFLHYFMDEDDKKTLQENLSYVKSSKKSTKLTHKIAVSEKSIYNTKHIIFIQNKEDEKSTIVGIIKFDKI